MVHAAAFCNSLNGQLIVIHSFTAKYSILLKVSGLIGKTAAELLGVNMSNYNELNTDV
jgi:hypothetical protein